MWSWLRSSEEREVDENYASYMTRHKNWPIIVGGSEMKARNVAAQGDIWQSKSSWRTLAARNKSKYRFSY